MQSERWNRVYRVAGMVACGRPIGSRRFPDRVIVLVLLWAALNHKPISWACRRCNWPVWMQRLLRTVPSSTTMSRRLRTASVREFLDELLLQLQGPQTQSLFQLLDGTALEVRNHSTDPQAGYGWGSGRRARGYKLHVLLDSAGIIIQWRVAPMPVSEKTMAVRMVRRAGQLGYVLADGSYDSTLLHAEVAQRGGQLVAPRRVVTKRARRWNILPRKRSIDLLEGPSCFGRVLHGCRGAVERFFAHADSHSEGLGELPAWVRTLRRVRLWVHAKLIINAARITLRREARLVA